MKTKYNQIQYDLFSKPRSTKNNILLLMKNEEFVDIKYHENNDVKIDKSYNLILIKNYIKNITLEEVLKNLNLEQKYIYIGRKIPLPRLTAWYGSKPYNYSGIINTTKEMPVVIDTISKKINNLSSNLFKDLKIYNSCLVNFYRNEKDSISFHSDDESIFKSCDICSVTLGTTRNFIVRKKTDHKNKISIPLEDGDVLFMSHEIQKNWEHGIHKSKSNIGSRLNFTFRII